MPREEKKEDKIEALEKKVDSACAKLRKMSDNWKRFVKGHVDESSDGKIGSISIKLLGCICAIALIAAGLFAEDIAEWDAGSGRTGDAKITHDGTDYTLTIDKVAADSMTATGVIDGVPSSGGVASNSTTVAADTYGQVIKTTLTMSDVSVVIAEGGSGTNGYGGVKIYDFPEGRLLVQGVIVENFTFKTNATSAIDSADGGDFAFGTAVVTDGSMSGTMVDFCPSTSIDPITNVTDAALAASAQFDGTSTAKDLYVNLTIDDGDISATATNTVDATVTIHWIKLGDY